MKTFYQVMTFLMILIALYFSYMIVNVFYTIFKQKRSDHSMQFCLTPAGKAFYIIMTIIWIVLLIGCIAVAIIAASADRPVVYLNAMVVLALYTIVYSFQVANITLVGRKSLLVGRMSIDYRKMKKVDLNYHNELSFVYSQKSFKFSTRWVDVPLLRKSVYRRS